MKRRFFGPSGAIWLQVALVGAAAVSVAVAAPSCGGDVVVDGNPSSSGSGEGGASNTTGTPSGPAPVAQSGVGASGPSVASSGQGAGGPVGSVGPGPGPVTAVTAVSTGMVPCTTCSEFISGFEGQLCPQSQAFFDALLSCVCSFCSFQCAGTCNGGGENGPQCDQCVEFTIQDACSSQFASCVNDT
jgi:hypothetical protein